MGLQSLQYCAFLVVVAAVYLHLPVRMQPVFLLGASWVFYALAMPAMLPVTIALAVFTYLCGRGLAWRGGAHKTAFLRLGVIGMLGILAFFKYNGLLGGVLHGWRAVAMPLGISFTSFAAIAYLIDATRGDCEVETSFIRLALFLNFFATVTQGPICRAGALLPQLSAEHRFDAARTVRALRLYALGLFKYIAVADVLNMVVDTVFPHYADYSAPMLILTAVMYTFYLYFSFSGYSEISRATGLVLGLDLPENFKTPFYATNFSGFWSRWHISLSTWFREYLYIPLGGNRCSKPRWMFNLLVVWAATGIWHGASWNYLIWGLYFFVLLMVEKFFLLDRLSRAPAAVGHVYTMFFVLVSWAIFAIEDAGHLAGYLRVMFGLGGVPLADPAFGYYLTSYLPILCVAGLASTPLGASLYRRLKPRTAQAVCAVLVLAGLVVCTAYLVDGTYNPFLYFRF